MTAPASSVAAWRAQFPILAQEVNGHPLAYFDNAATAQKPLAVLEALDGFYRRDNANIHRGVHTLSHRATALYEGARAEIAAWLGAAAPHEVIFVRGATEALNMIALGLSRHHLKAGDEVLLTEMEHHANIVPWQWACEHSGAVLKVARVTDGGEIDRAHFRECLASGQVKVAAFTHVSNALGTVNPVAELAAEARAAGALVVLDACQSAPHLPLDVNALGADFLVFSGHKLYGPTGSGVLWGRAELLRRLPPFLGGGDMVRTVRFERTTYKDLPERHEAGTPDIAAAVGLAAAVRWWRALDHAAVRAHEDALRRAAEAVLDALPGVRRVGGQAPERAPVVSWTMEGIHPHDIGTFLDQEGIAVRAGHHCAQPLMRRYGLGGTARASFALYNTLDEINRLDGALRRLQKFFAV